MYKRILVLVILVIRSTCVICAEQQEVQATLSVIPENTLPGIPVAIRLVISNLGSSAILLPMTATLQVSPDQGESFEAVTGSPENPTVGWLYSNENQLESLAPKETREFYFGIDTRLAAPEWFHDVRLSWPGRYKLQMVLDANLSLSQSTKEEGTIPQVISSSEAYLTVEQPYGEDLLVWQRMLEITKGKGWGTGEWSTYGAGLGKEIWEQHRTSNYTPYIIIMAPITGLSERAANVEQALLKYPNHIMTPYYHFALADLYENLMWSKFASKEISQAKIMNEKWQLHLKAITHTTNDPALKSRAQQDSIGNWDRVYKAYKERQNLDIQKP